MVPASSLWNVLLGGIVAGTFDILFAICFWSVKSNAPPTRILQSVAAGLLGKDSFKGGVQTAALGLCLHFFIAISMAFAYLVMARQWPVLAQRPWLYGAIYGIGLYLVMNFVVIPLSAASTGSKDVLWIVLSVIVHSLLIGVPIALFVRRALA